MKAVLIDSDVLIDVSRARDDSTLKSWYALARGEAVVLCSAVTVAELWHGVRPSEEGLLRALFSTMTCVPIDADIGQRAGLYLRQFAKSYGVELGDALIAATAAVHKLELWTRNRRHYPMKEITFYSF